MNLLFTFELARRLEGTGVTANAVHPGLARSGLIAEAPGHHALAAEAWISAPPQRAATDIVRLAIRPSLRRSMGSSFIKERVKASEYAHDREAQRSCGMSALNWRGFSKDCGPLNKK